MAKSSKNPEDTDKHYQDMTVEELAACLSSASRRDRQNAAACIAELSKIAPELLLPCKDEIVDALGRPEGRTRWECLDALTALIPLDSSICEDAYEAVEESMFDEQNGTVRLASLRFACKMGSVSEDMASQVWPIIDECLQCYHGDPEYTDMLVAVNDFANCKLPASVAQGIIDRMEFDANNEKSGLLRRSNSIIESAKRSL